MAAAKDRTLILFNYDWDQIAFSQLKATWPQSESGFDLFTFPSNARLAWFNMSRFVDKCALIAKVRGAKAVASNHEQFGALCAALLAEKMGWPGTPVHAVLACQHKLYARQILQEVAPEATVPACRIEAAYGDPIPEGLNYPAYVKPVKAAFSVLAKKVFNREELESHTRFRPWELWVIRHLVEPFEQEIKRRLPEAGTAHSLMLEQPVNAKQYSLDGYRFNNQTRVLGCVDSVMYPGTDAFMRFDYPSRLPLSVAQKAQEVADLFLSRIGFSHGMFNMEFFYDAESDKLTVIEFNPRMAAQFSDLYMRVDGINLHEIALLLAHGLDPEVHCTRLASKGTVASSLVYRTFSPTEEVDFPTQASQSRFHREFPDALFFEFKKQPGQIARDFKWLNSYRYGIVHLHGQSFEDLVNNTIKASDILGWAPPVTLQEKHSHSTREPLTAQIA